MRTRVGLLLAAVGVLSLATNRLPWVSVGALTLAAALGAKAPGPLGWRVVGVAAWWAFSFLLTGESWSTFASFDFHRRDGQIFFSLLPLVVLSWLAPSAAQARDGLKAFCIVQAAVALVAFFGDLLGARGALEGFVFVYDEGPDRANYCGLYLAHNAAGSVQGLCCLAALAMAAFRQGTRERWLWGLLSVPLLWGLLMSRSRGALLALAGAVGVLAILAFRRRIVSGRALLGVGVVVLVTAAAFGASIAHRFAALAADRGTHTYRLEQWKRAFREWTWSPIVGEGLGRFNDTDREWSGLRHVYYVVTRATEVKEASHAHNSYFHFLAEGGLIGFGVTVGFWAWVAWTLRRSREPFRLAAFLGVVFLFLVSFTEHYMGGGAMLLALSSLVGAAWRLPDEPAPGTIGAA
jgi:O-antigen ligase